jgi:hypothetical protein
MTFALYFVPSQFPRTITRAEWKEIWRWKRVTQKILAEEYEKRRNDLAAFGHTYPDWRMISPPLLIHDKQNVS